MDLTTQILAVALLAPSTPTNYDVNNNVNDFCKKIPAYVGTTEKEVLLNWGSPKSISKESEKSIHEKGKINTLIKLRYFDSEVSLYETPYRSFLIETYLTKEFYPKQLSSVIGKDTNYISRYFGKADKATPESLKYHCSIETSEWFVVFQLKNGKVDKIKYKLYLD